ncbi:hypothetical protein [Streptomyces bullii]|uniref:Uncharacterized protein n=1 Tax=Streptomyces bullii TaxID=349910 RepID=A0ABW0UJG2_9ACTN
MQQLPTALFVEPSADQPINPAETDVQATIQALVSEHGLAVEEFDTAPLAESIRSKFMAFFVQTGRQKVVVFPLGQDLGERLWALRTLLRRPEVTA